MLSKRSKPRQALADAIAARNAAMAECDEATAALDEFDELLWETQSGFHRAQDSVKEAKELLEERLRVCAGNEDALALDAARIGQPPYRQSIAAAEANLVEAEKRYALGKEGRAPLYARKVLADDVLPRLERKVLESIYLVEQSERLPALLADACKATEVAAIKRAVVGHIGARMDGVLSNTRDTGGLALEVQQYLGGSTRYDAAEALAPWEAAREALKRDADAALPDV